MEHRARAAPRPAPRPRGRRRGRGPRRPAARRDPRVRADHLRPVHGAGPVRARPRLLPPARSGSRAARRLPHRARGPPDLRGGAGPARGAGVGRAGAARPVHRHGARRRDRGPRRRPPRRAAGPRTRRSSARSGTARSRWSRRGSTALRERLDALGLGDTLLVDAPTTGGETGAVVANEVLDALPVHRVVGRPGTAGGIAELLVAVDDAGAFVAHEGPPSTPRLAERLAAEGVTLADGQVTEICLALDDWLAGATRHLATGVVVLVDYADEPAALHDPARRPTGTLRAFAAHAVGADPFRHVGRQDLTATVDLAAVRAAAARAGLEPLGETTQAELIATLGTGGPDAGVPPPRGRRPPGRPRAAERARPAARPARDGRVPRAGVRPRTAPGHAPGRPRATRPAASLTRVCHPSDRDRAPCAAARMARPGPRGHGAPTASIASSAGRPPPRPPASRSTSRTS